MLPRECFLHVLGNEHAHVHEQLPLQEHLVKNELFVLWDDGRSWIPLRSIPFETASFVKFTDTDHCEYRAWNGFRYIVPYLYDYLQSMAHTSIRMFRLASGGRALAQPPVLEVENQHEAEQVRKDE